MDSLIRNDILRYREVPIVWPGLIKDSKIVQHDENIEIIFLLEHHYYDWIEDFGAQREKMFLSPRGEGLFAASWFMNKDVNLPEIKKATAIGNLAIVYGMPERVEDNVIFIKSSYVRSIDAQRYGMDIFDYGRRGEPMKFLKVPK